MCIFSVNKALCFEYFDANTGARFEYTQLAILKI